MREFLKRLWYAECAAWGAWRRAMRKEQPEPAPVVLVPVVEVLVERAVEAAAFIAEPIVPVVALQPEKTEGPRWTLFREDGAVAHKLQGDTPADLRQIKAWEGPKYDSVARSWR